MNVIIGVDPHKATHTAVAIGCDEAELATVTVRATKQQADRLVEWAKPFKKRTWAIESAGGLGYLLASSSSMPARFFSMCPRPWLREYGCSGRGSRTKPTPTTPGRWPSPPCGPQGSARCRRPIMLMYFASWPSATDIGSLRTKLVCRLHAKIASLAAGGIAKGLNASDADGLLGAFECAGVQGQDSVNTTIISPPTLDTGLSKNLILAIGRSVAGVFGSERFAVIHASGRQCYAFGDVDDRDDLELVPCYELRDFSEQAGRVVGLDHGKSTLAIQAAQELQPVLTAAPATW